MSSHTTRRCLKANGKHSFFGVQCTFYETWECTKIYENGSHHLIQGEQIYTQKVKILTPVGFEPTLLRTGTWSQRLRPLGQSVHEYLIVERQRRSAFFPLIACLKTITWGCEWKYMGIYTSYLLPGTVEFSSFFGGELTTTQARCV